MYHFWHDRKKCCVACCHAYPRNPTALGRRDWRTCESPLRREESEAFGTGERFFIKRRFSERDFLSLPLICLLLSSTYYFFSPNSRRSPSARSFSILPSFPSSYSPSARSQLAMEVPPSPSCPSPSSPTTHISTKSFDRTPISARHGGTVARRKLQSSEIKGGSGGRGRGRGEEKETEVVRGYERRTTAR